MGGPGGLKGTMLVSLDHSMWFHSDARRRLDLRRTMAGCSFWSRGLAQARMWQNEQLVVSIAQEALTRF